MKNKSWKLVVILFFGIFIIAYFGAAKDEDKKAVTQGELAKVLAERMDLGVPQAAPAGECFKMLEAKGIKPTEGWSQEKPVTRHDLGEVLVEAGRLQAEVLSGKEIQSVLKERGIILPNEINKKTMDDVLKDQNVNRLLETPALSGPSVPFPKEEVKIIETMPEYVIPDVEAPPPTEPPPTEPPPTEPPPPPTTEPIRPSGGGAQ